jgi:hypothetical protein
MLIAEQLMLLCIDPQRGDFEVARTHADINSLAAAALILDLAEQHRLRFKNGHIALEASLPTTHPQLAQAAQILSGPANGLPMSAAIELLVTRMHPVARHLLESLFRRDVVHRVRASWWPWSALHFPLRSLQVLNEARTQLHKAIEADKANLRGLGLLVLTDFAGQLAASLSGDAHEAAMQKLLHLAKEPVGQDAEHDMLVHLRRCLLG